VRAAQVWRSREAIEHEAAALFLAMAYALRATASSAQLIDMSFRSATDEQEHAGLCRQIVAELAPYLLAASPDHGRGLLGSEEMGDRAHDLRSQLLYTMVATCCVTESLSAALLVEMQHQVIHPLVKRAVHRIATDEVRHSRLGWAYLASLPEGSDRSWLGPYVPRMIDAALRVDVAPVIGIGLDSSADQALAELGVLPAGRSRNICEDTISRVIWPGLSLFGILS
jgi:hypothetical protein